ncbi:hypothetical protein M153_10540002927, partial [Pseudoloma neurophilia]
MPSFKKKQFKNTFLQKVSNLKCPRIEPVSKNVKKEIKETQYLMVHTFFEKNLPISDQIVKTTKYKFVSGIKSLLANTMPNIVYISEKDISLNMDTQTLIEKISTLIADLNVKVDMLCFPSRSLQIANKHQFSKILRTITNYFKKLYKVSTLDDILPRLPSICATENDMPILQIANHITIEQQNEKGDEQN